MTLELDEPGTRTRSRTGFDRRLLPFAGFLLAAAALPVVTLGVLVPLTGPLGFDPGSTWVRIGITALGASLLFVLGFVVLRWEGVELDAVGLSVPNARRAVVWFAAVVLATNALLFVLSVTVADSWAVSTADVPPTVWVGLAVSQWVFVGLAEELTGRAYLQNKLVAVFGGERDLSRRAGALVVMAVLFALWHVPQRLLIAGRTPADLPAVLLPLVGIALVLGVVYELTRNVVLVALVHGSLNLPPVFLSVYGSEGWQAAVLVVALVAPYVVGVFAYRRWTGDGRDPRTTPV